MTQAVDEKISEIIDFPELEDLENPTSKLPPIKVNGVAKVSVRLIESGILVNINNYQIRLRYPPSIWNRFPKGHRRILSQNLTYALTFQLPYLYTSLKRMFYNMPVPLSESFFFKAFLLALPSTAMMNPQKEGRITSNLLRRLYEINYIFTQQKTDIPPYNRTSLKDRAIMPFTFGKDSLLTLALATELGIHVYPIYISEPYSPFEEYIKKQLSEPFKREFHKQIGFLRNTLGILREPDGWYGWELQLTQYSLMFLPYVYAKRAAYIFFSNEQSCDSTVIDEDGFKCNPVYEQSHEWLLQNSLMTSIIGGNSLRIGSLLEPIHDLGIMKILHTRYPEYGKFQTSCDMPDKPKSDGRWCENCSKCGRIYIFLCAIGVDPKTIGFKHDLLRSKYQHLYTLFTTNRIKETGYDQSEAGRDEQILAFYMAYKNGYKGPVMNLFVRHYLAYAKKHEKKLRQIYFGIHSTKTVPQELRTKLLRIYRQELDNLR